MMKSLKPFIMLLLLYPALSQAATKGEAAADFSLPALSENGDGPTLSLADYRGKVVYLDFWASWCPPCLVSMPLLDDLRKRYLDKGFEVLAVNINRDSLDAVDFLLDRPVTYPVLADPEGKTPALYRIKSMPSSFLIDREGNIRLRHEGFKPSDIELIEEHLNILLGETP